MKAFLVAVVAALPLLVAGPALGQNPPEGTSASCVGILTVNDAKEQFRDDISREVKMFVHPPGAFFSHFAIVHQGTTVEECQGD